MYETGLVLVLLVLLQIVAVHSIVSNSGCQCSDSCVSRVFGERPSCSVNRQECFYLEGGSYLRDPFSLHNDEPSSQPISHTSAFSPGFASSLFSFASSVFPDILSVFGNGNRRLHPSCSCIVSFLGMWDYCDKPLSDPPPFSSSSPADDTESFAYSLPSSFNPSSNSPSSISSLSFVPSTTSSASSTSSSGCHPTCLTCTVPDDRKSCLTCPLESSMLTPQSSDGAGMCIPVTENPSPPGTGTPATTSWCHSSCAACRSDCCSGREDNCLRCWPESTSATYNFVPMFSDGTGKCETVEIQSLVSVDGTEKDEAGKQGTTVSREQGRDNGESASIGGDESAICRHLPKLELSKRFWTHMVYMHADNNLENSALQDMREIRQPDYDKESDAMYVSVLIDRAAGHSSKAIGRVHACPGAYYTDDTKQSQVRVSFEQAYHLLRIRTPGGPFEWLLIRNMGEVDMNSKSVLEEFIRFSIKNFPADHIALTLWNHGGAWAGIGDDDGNRDGRSMSIQTIGNAMDAGLAGRKLSVFGFDACLMNGYSIVEALGRFTHYFVGSEDNEPGHGWNWRALKPAQDGGHVSTSAFDYAVEIVKAYGRHRGSHPLTLSVIEIAKFTEFKKEFEALLERLFACGGRGISVLVRKSASESYGIEGCRMVGLCGCVDLGDLLNKLLERMAYSKMDDFLQDQVLKVRRLHNEMVVESVSGDNARYTGMNIYLPDPNFPLTCENPGSGRGWARQFQYDFDTNWARFLKSVTSGEEGRVCYSSSSADPATDATVALITNRDKPFHILQGDLTKDGQVIVTKVLVPDSVMFAQIYRGAPSSGDWVYLNSVATMQTSDLHGVTQLRDRWDGTLWIGRQAHLPVAGKDPRPLPPSSTVHSSLLFVSKIEELIRFTKDGRKEELTEIHVPFLFYPNMELLRCRAAGVLERSQLKEKHLKNHNNKLASDLDPCALEAHLVLMYERVAHKAVTTTLYVTENNVLGEWFGSGVLRPVLHKVVRNPAVPAPNMGKLREMSREIFLWGEGMGDLSIDPVQLEEYKQLGLSIQHSTGGAADLNAPNVKTILSVYTEDSFGRRATFAGSIEGLDRCEESWKADGVCDKKCLEEGDGSDCPSSPSEIGELSPQLSGPCVGNRCSQDAICIPDMQSETYKCKCNKGFVGDGELCLDIDECKEGLANCHALATCANSEGSYRCICNEGLIGDGKQSCRPADGCTPSHQCPAGLHCLSSPVSCGCKEGYTRVGDECQDVDECEIGVASCSVDGMCINVPGAYLCSCRKGYVGDGRTCIKGKAVATGRMVISLDYSEVEALGVEQFKNLFLQSVTKAVRPIAPRRLELISIEAGSIIVTFRILPANDPTELNSAEALLSLQKQLSEQDSPLMQGEFQKYARLATLEDYKFESLDEGLNGGDILHVLTSWLPNFITSNVPAEVIVTVMAVLGLIVICALVCCCCHCCCKPYCKKSSPAYSPESYSRDRPPPPPQRMPEVVFSGHAVPRGQVDAQLISVGEIADSDWLDGVEEQQIRLAMELSLEEQAQEQQVRAAHYTLSNVEQTSSSLLNGDLPSPSAPPTTSTEICPTPLFLSPLPPPCSYPPLPTHLVSPLESTTQRQSTTRSSSSSTTTVYSPPAPAPPESEVYRPPPPISPEHV